MMNLIGQAIRHNNYGKGVVIDMSPGNLTVCFADGDREFSFPDELGNTLTLRNRSLQKNILEGFA